VLLKTFWGYHLYHRSGPLKVLNWKLTEERICGEEILISQEGYMHFPVSNEKEPNVTETDIYH
jgi:hypothetical protein